MFKKNAFDWIEGNSSRLIAISDKIWGFAELGLQEFKSFTLLADELENNGFLVQRGVAGMPTAFVAIYGSGKPVIGVTGEYDALPGLSQKLLSHKEPLVEGLPGHGCGHNIHGTSGLAGAIAVKVAMEKSGIKGTIKFFGCPAEETVDAKAFMIREGVFDCVDAVLSHHPGSVNTAGLSSSNAMNSVKFVFNGKASHAAASPEQGRSALDAVELMNVGVNYLREHVVQEARIHYIIEAGGEQPNVVPPYACSWYYVRAPQRDQVDSIYERILDISRGAELMTGTTCKIVSPSGIYNKIPNRTLSELVVANMQEIGTPEYSDEERRFAHEISKTITREQKRNALRKSKRPGWEKLMDVELDQSIVEAWNEEEISAGSTDLGDVTWLAPTMEFSTAAHVLGIPGHSWQIVAQSGMGIGHKSLIFAAKTLSASIIDLLTRSDLLKRAENEFKEKLGDQVYKSILSPSSKPPLDIWARQKD